MFHTSSQVILLASEGSTISIHWSAIWGSVAGVAGALALLRQYVVKPVKDTLAEIRQAQADAGAVRQALDDHLHWHAEHPMVVDKDGVVPVPWDGTDRRANPPRPHRPRRTT